MVKTVCIAKSHAVRGVSSCDASGLFVQLFIQLTANCGPAQRNGFHYPILVFFLNAESDNHISKGISLEFCR